MVNPVVTELAASRPDIWRASQMGSYRFASTRSGHARLDAELPDHGWPASTLIELLMQQSGIGELQLLRPALGTLAATRNIAMIQPPYLPQATAWLTWGLPADNLYWIKTGRTADALWTAEQILRNGSCGAVLLWQSHVRSDALRRLNLAAQGAQTTFWLLRPLVSAQDPSPAPLRLGVRPAVAGVDIAVIKRRGPVSAGPFFLPLADMPVSRSVPQPIFQPNHAPLDQRAPALPIAGISSPALV